MGMAGWKGAASSAIDGRWCAFRSPELEPLEPLQRRSSIAARPLGADVGSSQVTLLHQQLAGRAVGLEVERRHDAVAHQHRQGEIAELALGRRDIGFEDVVIAEEQLEPLALDDQRIEGREDVDQARRLAGGGVERLRARPSAGPFQRPRWSPAPAACARTRLSISSLTACLLGASSGRSNRG